MKLCCKHRTMAQWSPAQAELMWQRLVRMGREKIDQQRWCEAVGIYGSAFETAEILLMLGENERSLEVERYKRTAMEFIYCLRNSHYLVDLDGLIAMIHEKLIHEDERQSFGSSLVSVINSLSDAAFAPLIDAQVEVQAKVETNVNNIPQNIPRSSAQEWMNLLSGLSEKNSTVIH